MGEERSQTEEKMEILFMPDKFNKLLGQTERRKKREDCAQGWDCLKITVPFNLIIVVYYNLILVLYYID